MLNRCGYAVALLLTLPPIAHAQTDVLASQLAYFSPQRAFALSPDGKLAQTRLQAVQGEWAKEAERRNQQLQELQGTLQQSTAMLTEAARRLREQEIAKFQVELDRFMQDAQAEFAGVQRDLETAFLTRLRPALEASHGSEHYS